MEQIKIDLREWAKEELVTLNSDKIKVNESSGEERDEYYTEIGNKYAFCLWLKDKGYLRDGVTV